MPTLALGVVDESLLAGPWGPWLPGFVREATTSTLDRHDVGVHHTPPDVVDAVLDRALAHAAALTDTTTVLDPAVGGGAFLLAMAERLPGDRASIVARLHGVDVDPLAVGATRAALALWAGVEIDPENVRVGDHLVDDPFAGERFDLVVGNPPFLSQLRGGTPRTAEQRTALASRWPGVGGYVDDAAAFLLAAVDGLVDDGTVVLVQPASVLGAADATPVRERLAAVAPLRALWVDPGRAFAAGVDTVAVVCRRRRARRPRRAGTPRRRR
ncbi:MAG: N-6 DNA methylase, partial [Actinomycetota bacterium]